MLFLNTYVDSLSEQPQYSGDTSVITLRCHLMTLNFLFGRKLGFYQENILKSFFLI